MSTAAHRASISGRGRGRAGMDTVARAPRRYRRSIGVALTAVAAAALAVVPVTASAEDSLLSSTTSTVTSTATQTLTTNWAEYLPAYIGPFDAASSNECLAGKDNCVRRTINEMAVRLKTLVDTCDHNAVFALAYARITQGYEWIRNTENGLHYQDKAWMNYVVETFARAYLRAFDDWASPDAEAVPAWEVALDAAKARTVTGTGDLILGINAHINRDLAFVMASTGLVNTSGQSGKPDYDKVNDLLYLLTGPLTAELAQRLDPSMASGDNSLADPATFQLIVGWRERAWRNAEDLLAAPSNVRRALVAERIEQDAAAEATLLLASTSNPPGTTSAARDAYCAEHNDDAAPKAYPFESK